MATLSQLHLTRAASANLHPRHTAILGSTSLSSHPSLGLIRGGVPRLCISNRVSSRREVLAARTDSHGESEMAVAKEESHGLLSRMPFQGAEVFAAAAGVVLSTAGPAHALIIDEVEEMMRFSPEAWIDIYLATGVWLVLYFLVIPLIIYNYLRLRWYKRTFAETYFQFMLVFVFFPGMLLLAPFINFRRLPQDGAEEP
jgi:hypothetical protein